MTRDCTQDIDGCSGGVDWVYRRILRRPPPYGYCCDEHDVAYCEGGGWRDRWLADWRFARCLWEAGRKGKAVLFWLAVRLGGRVFWNREPVLEAAGKAPRGS